MPEPESEPERPPLPEEPPVRYEPPAPPEEASAPEEAPDLWRAIQKRLSPRLTMEHRTIINNPDMILGTLQGDTLQLEAAPGYAYMRFNRPELLQLVGEAASAIRGKETRVQLIDRKPRQQVSRSLDELRSFKEVHFIE